MVQVNKNKEGNGTEINKIGPKTEDESIKFTDKDNDGIPDQGVDKYSYSFGGFDDEFFDYIMIDGAHEYEAVKKDIENWWPKLKPEGVMLGDDFDLESVSEAVRQMMTKLNTEGFSVNGSREQTWFTSKGQHHKKLEKIVPGVNSLT